MIDVSWTRLFNVATVINEQVLCTVQPQCGSKDQTSSDIVYMA